MYILYASSQSHCVQAGVYLGHRVFFIRLGACSTSLQDLLDFDVVRTEAAVELEVVGVVQERPPERKQQLL